ncbi:MAG: nitrile hydratase subunit beta [Geminicoccaceae bacterium]|nr:nitrile hydratase subunit beta [Geminicoccaceae bacterium]MCX8101203.1 nitrile hydratase subunit beta [Geminicoccaceae bacterium]MDW8368962.1 nitrile hydratase subunit beta [Geminicoccaceae bacterium]
MNRSIGERSSDEPKHDFELFFLVFDRPTGGTARSGGLPEPGWHPTLDNGESEGTRMRRHHDMGGLEAGPIERNEHALEPWEKKVDALLRLLMAKKIMTLDELRRGIEELGPGAYDELSYFERWIASIANILVEKGVLTVQELGEAIEVARARRAEAAACTAEVEAP